jgi:outer membrane receptor for ferrienterochelin and colicin
LSGLRASVDRFEIYMKGAIGTISSQNTVDYCFAGNQVLCSFIERDASGAITLVGAQYVNLGYIKTSGIDYEVAYSTPFPVESVGGDLDLRVLATWVEKYVTSDGGRNIADTVGSLSRLDWKVSTRLTYTNGAFRFYAENQFVPKLMLDSTYTEIEAPLSQRILPSMNWTNVSLSYDILNEGTRRVQLFGAVNNIFDTNPPITPNTGVTGAQSDAGVYDVLGRRYQVGLRFSY